MPRTLSEMDELIYLVNELQTSFGIITTRRVIRLI